VNIRKEQVLLLSALAWAGWQYSSWSEARPTRPYQPKVKEWQQAELRTAALIDGTALPAGKLARREIWREPSETQPLPPMPLPFPAHRALSLLGLPLDCGRDLGHLHTLVLPGDPVDGVTIAFGGAAAAPAAEAGSTATNQEAGPDDKDKKAQAARIYDRVVTQGGEFFGLLEPEGIDRYELETLTDFSGVKFKLRGFSIKTWSLMTGPAMTWQPKEVIKIQLANTLRNEVERQKRKFTHDAGHLADLGNLIDWLLQKGREELWVFDEAQKAADEYLSISKGDLDGWQWKVRVLAAMGALEDEYELYQKLEGRWAGSAFQLEGRGRVKARLGLFAEAEADLRQAVAAAPQDARPRATLASFLRERERPQAALQEAKAAFTAVNSLTNANERARVLATMVWCQLTVGEVTSARATLATAGAAAPPFLRAAVDYAAGDAAAALANFRQVASGPDAAAAQLGAAACLLLLQQWQEAATVFEAVNEQAPLLRHRALTGLALLALRLGQRDQAVSFLDRALEASPQDAYAQYLKGRVLRDLGQLKDAQDALAATLKQRDDCVLAVAEMALLHSQLAKDGAGRDQAEHYAAATRYMDRAVVLARPPSVELLEQQGMLRQRAADLGAAEAAFTAARDAAADEPGKLFAKASLALLDYARGRIDEARTQLRNLAEPLAKDQLMRLFAEDTLDKINDHSQKELLEDRFERTEPGKSWTCDRIGELGAAAMDGWLQFKGPLTRVGEVTADRVGALPHGGRFLAVGVKMQIGAAHQKGEDFAGLRLESQKNANGSAPELLVKLGLKDGKPSYWIQDGRNEPLQGTAPFAIDPAGVQELEIRVEPDAQKQRLVLLLSWNGQQVAAPKPLDILRPLYTNELHTILFVAGAKDHTVDVRFDDYRLERRKDG